MKTLNATSVIKSICLVAASLIGLNIVTAEAASQDKGFSQKYTATHTIFAWKSDNYSGSSFVRSWDGDISYLWTDVKMSAGGVDSGVSKSNVSSKKVDSIAVSQAVEGTLEASVSGAGHWWAGPKTIITSTSTYTGLDGQYECYIIEKAEKTPSALVTYMGGTYKGEGTYNGSVYKHYTTKYGKINQIWSIRQTYRNGGYTSVGYIMKDWRKLGIVPNWYCLGWKYNVEFNGANDGYVGMSYLKLPFN
jgi:hypothetical protein